MGLQGFMDWGAIYVKYLQTFRNLEQVYDQMVHPQKRIHIKKALEICAGRMLEVRAWLVRNCLFHQRAHIPNFINRPKVWNQPIQEAEKPWTTVVQVELNNGNEILDLKNVLLDLKLPPEALEVPVPQFFVEERAKVHLTI